eukprot:6484293-Karenia_brevis.AAC.1
MQPSQHDAATTATVQSASAQPYIPLHPGVSLGRVMSRNELPKLIRDPLNALLHEADVSQYLDTLVIQEVMRPMPGWYRVPLKGTYKLDACRDWLPVWHGRFDLVCLKSILRMGGALRPKRK